MTALILSIDEIHSNLSKEIDNLRTRVKKCEIRVDDNSSRLEICEKLGKSNSQEIKHLDKKVTAELSRCSVKVEEKIPYVFSAPVRNRYFSGRTREIQELKHILKVGQTLNEKKIRVAGVCGLGGVGKTTLVSEYAHQMKDFYKGGVYWFSAEDDTFLEKTVQNIAAKSDALGGSFDLTLSNFFRKIGTTHDPSLIVLDCLDQLDLSCQTLQFLHSASQENVFGHFLVLTRRDPNRLVNEVSVFEEDSLIHLKCFRPEEAKHFLFLRTGVDHDLNVENIAESLCDELGGLPLALEQAGACIKMLRCSLSSYLQQYRTERLRLLSQEPARSVSPGNESSQRLAVHTTWLINLEYIKESPYGQAAVRFMNACSFFNGNEIEEQLLNVGKPALEDVEYCERVSSPLGARQVLKPLTDFSLFTHVEAQFVSTHRLVQELVRESLDPKSKIEAFSDAVRILNYAFSECPSPSKLINLDESKEEEQYASRFYMWSKLCVHAQHLSNNIEDLLTYIESVHLITLATILYECAIYLSAHHKQEEAKRALNFGYRILDWIPLTECKAVKKSISNKSLFPYSIPLPQSIQIMVKQDCVPPFAPLQPLTFKPPTERIRQDLEQKIEELKLSGEKCFDDGCYQEALDAYSSAIDLGQDCNSVFNPMLLTDRSMTFLKLKQYENALQDANDYITRRPDCWRGYAFKALALDGLKDKVSAGISAALAFYHNRTIFSEFLPFKCFLELQKRIFICDSVEELEEAIFSPVEQPGKLRILVLGSSEYILNFRTPDVPWDNCVLVGARKNRSISLKSNHCILLLKCMLVNLSFLTYKCPVRGIAGSIIKVLNCNIFSFDAIAAVITEGKLNAEHCIFTSCKGPGLVCFGAAGDSVVVDCTFCNNGRSGVEVYKGGVLNVKSSRMFNNRRFGLLISNALKCVSVNCDLYQNKSSGIHVRGTNNVLLECNRVFDNREDGIYTLSSQVNIKENNCFDNGSWGIFSTNSYVHISKNEVFSNKAGGVRVGYPAGEETFSPSVVEMNRIYDNFGPGLIEEKDEMKFCENETAKNDCRFGNYRSIDNEVRNNKETHEKVRMLNFSIPYCSNCRTKCTKLKKCTKCLTSAYCQKFCEECHWPQHKEICKLYREKSSCLVTFIERAGYGITAGVEGLKDVGPDFIQDSPQEGKVCVVKVYSEIVYTESETCLVVYDRSCTLHHAIDSEVITELVKEFGVLCKRQFREKKLFFYCLLDNGNLRLFTNEFPGFQSW